MFEMSTCNLKIIKCEVKLKRLNIEKFQRKEYKEDNIRMLEAPNQAESVVKRPRRATVVKEIVYDDEAFDVDDDEDEESEESEEEFKIKNVKKKVKEVKNIEHDADDDDDDYDYEDDHEESEESGEEFIIKNVKKQAKVLSSYEMMILKNQKEKFAMLKSLKINEAKADFIESVNIVKKKPERAKRRPQIKKFIPDVLRKSDRITKMDVNLSEDALVELAWTQAAKEARKMVLPPTFSFEDALRFRHLCKDFENLDDTDKNTKAVLSNNPFQQSTRHAAEIVDYSDKPLSELVGAQSAKVEENKVISPVLSHKDALKLKDLYREFKILNDTDEKTKALVYDKDIFERMVLENSRISYVVPSKITALTVHPSCKKTVLCVGNSDGYLGIWNVESNTDPFVCCTHLRAITNLQFNPDNFHQLVSSSYDGAVRIGDFEAKTFSEVYNKSSQATYCTQFDFVSPGTLLVAQANGKVSVIDSRSRRRRSEKQHKCHDTLVKTVHVHPVKKHYFITAAREGNICVWDLRKLQDQPVAYISKPCIKQPTYSAYFSPVTGNSVLTSSQNNMFGIYDSSVLSKELEEKVSMKTVSFWRDGAIRPKEPEFRQQYIPPRLTFNSSNQATWIPNTDDAFVVPYHKRIAVFNSKGYNVHNFVYEGLQSSTPHIVFHPFQPILAAGNTGRKVLIFKDLLT